MLKKMLQFLGKLIFLNWKNYQSIDLVAKTGCLRKLPEIFGLGNRRKLSHITK
jgi:hypothetical protein